MRRRGNLQPEDLARLQLREKPNLVELEQEWLRALDDAEEFIQSRPPEEIGCLHRQPVTKAPTSSASRARNTSLCARGSGTFGGGLFMNEK